MTNRTYDDYRAQADRFGRILDGVDGRWDAPTPCAGWSARDVVAHVIETERDFLRRHDLPVGAEADLGDPATAWRRHAAGVLEAIGPEEVGRRGFDGYFGPTTIGDTLTDFYGWDLVIHGWDVARATGQEWHLADEAAEAMSRTADTWGEALYSEGVCTAPVPVPDSAPAADRLLARLGRDPHWAP